MSGSSKNWPTSTVKSKASVSGCSPNIAAAMQGVPEEIVRKQIEHFAKADPAYGEGVKRALDLK
ncbi:catalase-related domain-containing protein [Cupriavidus oxalaticus]|jgi:catalase